MQQFVVYMNRVMSDPNRRKDPVMRKQMGKMRKSINKVNYDFDEMVMTRQNVQKRGEK